MLRAPFLFCGTSGSRPLAPVTVVVAMMFAIFVAEVLLALERFPAFVSPVTRLRAVRAEALDGLAVAIFAVGDTAIAIVPVVGLCGGRTGGKEQAEGRSGQDCFSDNRAEVEPEKFHESLQELGPGWSSGVRP